MAKPRGKSSRKLSNPLCPKPTAKPRGKSSRKRSNPLTPRPTIHLPITRYHRLVSLFKSKIRVKKVKVPKLPTPTEIPPSTFTFKHPMILRDGEPYDHDFGPWLERERGQTNPLYRFKLYGTKKRYHFVRDWVKKHIRSFLCLLYDVIHDRRCVSSESIVEENMVLVHNVIKFKKLELKKFDELEANSTFKKLGKFITESFFRDCESSQIPDDMRRLLCLLGQSACSQERLIKNHISLMTDRAMATFISSWHHLSQQHTPPQTAAYEKACKSLPQVKSWKPMIKGNHPFLFALSKSTYKNHATDLPRFIRNCLQHLIGACFMGRDGKTTPKQNFDDRDVVKMVVTVFHESIAMFPELLDSCGLLSLSRPEECFF